MYVITTPSSLHLFLLKRSRVIQHSEILFSGLAFWCAHARVCVCVCVCVWCYCCCPFLLVGSHDRRSFQGSQKFATFQRLQIFVTFWRKKIYIKWWIQASVEMCQPLFFVLFLFFLYGKLSREYVHLFGGSKHMKGSKGRLCIRTQTHNLEMLLPS